MMTRVLPTALVMGLLVGCLVAAYMNIFNVPVMEWAIALEGCDIDRAGCAEELAAAEDEDPLPLAFLTSLGGQRVGMSVGLAVIGILYAAIFTGLYHLMRNATPGWSPWAWAATCRVAGFLGRVDVHANQVPAESAGHRRRRDVAGAAGLSVSVHGGVRRVRRAGDLRGWAGQSRYRRQCAMGSLRGYRSGLRRGCPCCWPLPYPASATRPRTGCPPKLTIMFRTFHRRGAFAALDGHRLCHGGLQNLPRAG